MLYVTGRLEEAGIILVRTAFDEDVTETLLCSQMLNLVVTFPTVVGCFLYALFDTIFLKEQHTANYQGVMI